MNCIVSMARVHAEHMQMCNAESLEVVMGQGGSDASYDDYNRLWLLNTKAKG